MRGGPSPRCEFANEVTNVLWFWRNGNAISFHRIPRHLGFCRRAVLPEEPIFGDRGGKTGGCILLREIDPLRQDGNTKSRHCLSAAAQTICWRKPCGPDLELREAVYDSAPLIPSGGATRERPFLASAPPVILMLEAGVWSGQNRQNRHFCRAPR